MEPTEINETVTPAAPKELSLTENAQYFLHQTTKWTKFLSIMGFIGAALMVLVGIFFSTFYSALSQFQSTSSALPRAFGNFMGFFYILIAIFYFFASRYLYLFGERVKNGIEFGDPLQLEGGFEKLKSLFKMTGITTIVFLALYALIFIGVIVAAVIAAVAR